MPIIDPPPCFVSVERTFDIIDTISTTRSVYSFSENVLDFGGSAWTCEMQLHNLSAEDGGEVMAFIDRMRRTNIVCRFGAAKGRQTLFGGSTATALTVTADAGPGSTLINVSGNGAGNLNWGTLFQHGDRLFRNRSNLSGDAGSLAFWPSLKEPIFAGDVINLVEPKGVWRLDTRPQERQLKKWTLGGSARFIEAINYA